MPSLATLSPKQQQKGNAILTVSLEMRVWVVKSPDGKGKWRLEECQKRV